MRPANSLQRWWWRFYGEPGSGGTEAPAQSAPPVLAQKAVIVGTIESDIGITSEREDRPEFARIPGVSYRCA